MGRITLGQSFLDFAELLTNLGQHATRVGPVKARTRGLLRELGRPRQRRQANWHAIQHAVAGSLAGRRVSGLLLLERLPLRIERAFVDLMSGNAFTARREGAIREDMWMAVQHLLGQHMDHVVEIEALLLTGDLGVEDALKQQVTQFRRQLLEHAGIGCGALDDIGDLIGLLQGVRHQTRVILAAVPRAAVLRVTQHGHQGQQVIEGVARISLPACIDTGIESATHALSPPTRRRLTSMMLGSCWMRANTRPSTSRFSTSSVILSVAMLSS